MKKIGDILAFLGTALFVYVVIGRFVGKESVLGLSSLPVVGAILGKGFTAVGSLSGAACILLIAVIALLKAKD